MRGKNKCPVRSSRRMPFTKVYTSFCYITTNFLSELEFLIGHYISILPSSLASFCLRLSNSSAPNSETFSLCLHWLHAPPMAVSHHITHYTANIFHILHLTYNASHNMINVLKPWYQGSLIFSSQYASHNMHHTSNVTYFIFFEILISGNYNTGIKLFYTLHITHHTKWTLQVCYLRVSGVMVF